MEIEKNTEHSFENDFTEYPEVNKLLIDFTNDVKEILKENLVGIYLTGSLTYGDFKPGRSDIDLIVLTKNLVNESERDALEQLHSGIEQRNSEWKDKIECSYLPIDWLKNVMPPETPRPYMGGGTFYKDAEYGNEWIINNYWLYEKGLALYGPEIKTLIDPVDINQVQQACFRDLEKEWLPKLHDEEWLSDSHNQSYLVLNLCRILYTIKEAKLGSKKTSAEWVKSQYGSRWLDLIDKAENWHYGIDMEDKDQVLEFLGFVAKEVRDN